MPNIAAELPETYASITRPAAYEIVKQLVERLNIDPSEANIVMPGVNGKLSVWNADNFRNTDTANLPSRPRIHITVKEEYIESELMTMVSRKDEYPAIILDKAIGVKVAPIYSRTKVVVTIAYRARDRYSAESFRDNWRRKIAELRDYMVFNVRYTYPIPNVIIKVCKRLFEARSVNLHDYQDFETYLADHGIPQLTKLTNAAGNGDIYAIRERQENIYGNFVDPSPVEVEKDDAGSAWIVNFDFEYHYDKPITVYAEYPIIINNELVHPALYPNKVFDYSQYKGLAQNTRLNYHEIQNMMGYYWMEDDPYIRIPEFDYWRASKTHLGYKSLLSALVVVDPNDPTLVCNLTDLGDWGLNERLVPLFKENYKALTRSGEFPFMLRFHEGDKDPIYILDNLIVDEELNVRTQIPMSLFKVQHLTFDMMWDLRTLNPRAKEKFFKNPLLVQLWLELSYGGRLKRYPKVIHNQYIDIRDFERVCKEHDLMPNGRYRYFSATRLLTTVGIFTVTAQRGEDHANS